MLEAITLETADIIFDAAQAAGGIKRDGATVEVIRPWDASDEHPTGTYRVWLRDSEVEVIVGTAAEYGSYEVFEFVSFTAVK